MASGDERHELVEQLVERQYLNELRAQARPACIRPTSPTSSRRCRSNERLIVWDLVKAERDGEILLEVSDSVRESLIESMDRDGAGRRGRVRSTPTRSPTWPPTCRRDVVEEVRRRADPGRARAAARRDVVPGGRRSARGWTSSCVTVREDVTLEMVLRYLRRLRRAARAHRPGVRGRPRRRAERRAAARPTADQRARGDGRGRDASRRADAAGARRRRRGGAGVRALRPGVGAGRRSATTG